MKLIQSAALQRGDTVATVSLSWGGAGDDVFRWRYELGKRRLQEVFGLNVVEMPHTLAGSDFVYDHPEKRAEDLMAAFRDPNVKAIIACIGGSDSIRLLPYVDLAVIRDNPKPFLGFSDSTITHLFCFKAGITSFYGPAILTDFAENGAMFPYTIEAVQKTLFTAEPAGLIEAPTEWTNEHIPWDDETKARPRQLERHEGYEVLQGTGIHRGFTFGGCIEVLEFAKGTSIWPEPLDEAMLFFETSEEMPHPDLLLYWLRNYAAQGWLKRAKGLLFAKPYKNKYVAEYRDVILQVVRDEEKLTELPIFYNMSFGHADPRHIMPYGMELELDCEQKTMRFLQSSVYNR